MAEYDNTNSGALFLNEKRTKPNHPNFRGQCTIKTPDGELVEYWVSGWEKSGRKGPFVSLAFQLKEDAEGASTSNKGSFLSGNGAKAEEPKTASKKTAQEDLNDDIPF